MPPNGQYLQPPKPNGWRHKYARNPKPTKLHNIPQAKDFVPKPLQKNLTYMIFQLKTHNKLENQDVWMKFAPFNPLLKGTLDLDVTMASQAFGGSGQQTHVYIDIKVNVCFLFSLSKWMMTSNNP